MKKLEVLSSVEITPADGISSEEIRVEIGPATIYRYIDIAKSNVIVEKTETYPQQMFDYTCTKAVSYAVACKCNLFD